MRTQSNFSNSGWGNVVPDGPNRSTWRKDDRVRSQKSPGKVNAEELTSILEPIFHFPQDECWTSSKQSQVWSSTCHGQWWWWWPWRPVIFQNTQVQIFCKQLWSKENGHSKCLHTLPSWLILVFLCDDHILIAVQSSVKKSNFCQLETLLKYSCNASKSFFLHTNINYIK